MTPPWSFFLSAYSAVSIAFYGAHLRVYAKGLRFATFRLACNAKCDSCNCLCKTAPDHRPVSALLLCITLSLTSYRPAYCTSCCQLYSHIFMLWVLCSCYGNFPHNKFPYRNCGSL